MYWEDRYDAEYIKALEEIVQYNRETIQSLIEEKDNELMRKKLQDLLDYTVDEYKKAGLLVC